MWKTEKSWHPWNSFRQPQQQKINPRPGLNHGRQHQQRLQIILSTRGLLWQQFQLPPQHIFGDLQISRSQHVPTGQKKSTWENLGDFLGPTSSRLQSSLLQHLLPSLHKRLRVLMFHTRSCGFLWKLGKPPKPIVYHHDSIDMLLLGIHHFLIYPSSVFLVRSDPIPRRSHKITRTSPPNYITIKALYIYILYYIISNHEICDSVRIFNFDEFETPSRFAVAQDLLRW